MKKLNKNMLVCLSNKDSKNNEAKMMVITPTNGNEDCRIAGIKLIKNIANNIIPTQPYLTPNSRN